MRRSILTLGLFAASACSVCAAPADSLQNKPAQAPQTVQAKQEPPPSPPDKDQAWYWDPRWWGIGVSTLLGLASLGVQFGFRLADKKRTSAEAEFDSDLSDPIKDSFSGLRSLSSVVQAAAAVLDEEKRKLAVQKIREEHASQAFSPFSSAAFVADGRLKTEGYFTGLGSQLEDVFYPKLTQIESAKSPKELTDAGNAIAVAINELIASCTSQLRKERSRFRPTRA